MNEQERELNAETALAGAILVDARCLELIQDTLRESDFLDSSCRAVYAGARALEREGKSIDPVTIGKFAREHGLTLTTERMAHLMSITPTCEGAEEYARIVHENALRRAMEEACAEAGDRGKPLGPQLDRILLQLQNISTHLEDVDDACFGEAEYEPPRWLIEPYFQLGKGTLIQADPGTGKTAFMCAVAAAVSTGRGFLNLKVEAPGNVLMVSTEDDPGVLRGRIEACGGNPNRVFYLRNADGLTLDSPRLRRAIHRRNAKLLILDPFQSFLGSDVDMFRANETRPVLNRLFAMCNELDCACAIIAHLGKAVQGKSAVNQSLGSVDIPGIMRSILHIVRNPEMEGELLAFHVKSSNAAPGKTIAYTIGNRGGVSFTGYSDLKLADLSKLGSADSYCYDQEPMAEVLATLLAERGDGFVSYEDLDAQARKQLGTAPYENTYELLKLLRRPQFQRDLMQKDSVQLELSVKHGGKRGLILKHYRHPDGYQTGMDSIAPSPWTVGTLGTVKTEQQNRPQQVSQQGNGTLGTVGTLKTVQQNRPQQVSQRGNGTLGTVGTLKTEQQNRPQQVSQQGNGTTDAVRKNHPVTVPKQEEPFAGYYSPEEIGVLPWDA